MFNIVYNLIKINHKASEPVELFGNIFLMHFWNEKERSRGLMSYVKNMCVNVSQELPKDHYGTSWGCKSSGINFRFIKVFFIGLWISVRGFVDPLSFLTSHVQSAVSSLWKWPIWDSDQFHAAQKDMSLFFILLDSLCLQSLKKSKEQSANLRQLYPESKNWFNPSWA